MDARDQIKTCLLRLLALYNLNPDEQFPGEMMSLQVDTILNFIIKNYPTISPTALNNAVEYNLAGKFVDGIEVFHKINTDFISKVLQKWIAFKSKEVVKMRKLVPEKTTTVDPDKSRLDLIELMEEDRHNLQADDNFELRLPDQYYDMLLEIGKITENDDEIKEYKRIAKLEYQKVIAKKEAEKSTAVSIKEIMAAKEWLKADSVTHKKRIISIAKSLAVKDYLRNQL